MPGLPGTEASQDVKNAGSGCGSLTVGAITIGGLILATVSNPLGFLQEISTGVLWIICAILGIGLIGWILTLIMGGNDKK